MNLPYRILRTRYDPPRWNARLVGKELTRITKALGLVPLDDSNHRHQVKAAWCSKPLFAYVRRRTVNNPKAAQWHQDGDLDGGIIKSGIVVWTSNTPTEVKDFKGRVYKLPNRSLVLIYNDRCYHRRPPNAPRVRWLFRQRVKTQ